MPLLFEAEAFKLYAICSVLLALNLLFIANYTAIVRTRGKVVVNKEDARVVKGGEAAETEHPNVLRVHRAHRNALENIAVFWAIGLIYALTGPTALGAKAYFFTFTAARWLHTFFYLKAIQPFRTISFVVGALALLGMMIHVFRVAI